MTSALQILTINAACLGIAYLGIYPTMRDKSLRRLALADAVVTVLALGTSAALFAGAGLRFSLLGLPVGWFIFALVTFEAMALPLLIRFIRKYDIDLSGGTP